MAERDAQDTSPFPQREGSSEDTNLKAWLTNRLERLERANSSTRHDIFSEIKDALYARPVDLVVIMNLMTTEFQTHRYAQDLIRRLADPERIVRQIYKRKELPGFNDFLEITKNLDHSAVAGLILAAYLSLPGLILDKKGFDDEVAWDQITQMSVYVGSMLVALFDTEQLSTEQKELLAKLWYAEATRSGGENLGSILTTISHLNTASDINLEAGATLDMIFVIEQELLGRSREELELRASKYMSKALIHKVHSQGKTYNAYLEYYKQRIGRVEEFLKGSEQSHHDIIFPAHPSWVVRAANTYNALRQKSYIEADPRFGLDYISHPDGGHILVVRQSNQEPMPTSKDRFKDLLQLYSSETRPIHVGEEIFVGEEFKNFILWILCPEMNREVLLDEVRKSREKASGGLSTISERGDKAILRTVQSKGDEYLESLGIQSIIFRQTGEGIDVLMNVFNVPIPFHLDAEYQLDQAGEIPEEAHLWVENLCLSYVGHIKQQLAETEGEKHNATELGGSKVFFGRRPHLRVLHIGHESQKVDLYAPEKSMNAKEHEFILFHFGVSLYTLNHIFETVQDDITYLKPSEFSILFDLYDRQLPSHLRAKTSADSVRNIVIGALKRTTERKYKVRYGRTGIVAGTMQRPRDLEETTKRFHITFVHESKPNAPIEVLPMSFWCPQVSEQMLAMAEKHENTSTDF